jgi:hypothetical protein
MDTIVAFVVNSRCRNRRLAQNVELGRSDDTQLSRRVEC